eukprot:Filipodium_phascolosomae@DN8057_c0_g1_i1.p1
MLRSLYQPKDRRGLYSMIEDAESLKEGALQQTNHQQAVDTDNAQKKKANRSPANDARQIGEYFGTCILRCEAALRLRVQHDMEAYSATNGTSVNHISEYGTTGTTSSVTEEKSTITSANDSQNRNTASMERMVAARVYGMADRC